MMPLSLIPMWVKLAAVGALVAALTGGLWWWHHDGVVQGRAEVRAEQAIKDAEIARQSLKLSEQATRDSATLQANADKSTGAKNAQIARLNTDLSGALERLRERPERGSAAGVSGDPSIGAGPGCTAAQLFREDASALVREADRADRLLADLAQCQAAYGAARVALSEAPPQKE